MTDERGGAVARSAGGPAIDPSVCPLCGGPNSCGAAAGKRSCWCYATKIPPEVLDRIPAESRDQACICERCATSASPPEGASPRPVGLD
jgi:Cysteine-rich CWC